MRKKKTAKQLKITKRMLGINPRALGINPRALGINLRLLETDPEAFVKNLKQLKTISNRARGAIASKPTAPKKS